MADDLGERDSFGRPKFSGRSLITVNLDRPAGFIETFMHVLLPPFFPALSLDGNGSELGETHIYPLLGAAVSPLKPERLQEVIAINHEQLSGVTISAERLLYRPLKIASAARMMEAVLMKLGVQEDHAGKVKVLILDSGLDVTHPDFTDRGATAMSFIDDVGAADGDGHGTHCAGLACGTRAPATGLRYGVASEATLITGLVIQKETDSVNEDAVLRGLQWAGEHDVVVVNMSLGSEVRVGQGYNKDFEKVAYRALVEQKVLLVAAAGNDPEDTRHPIEHPANCPSVMAVAALTRGLRTWDRSCASINAGQCIDVAAPGQDIHSSDLNGLYKERSGTSMAAALVTGIAALWADTEDKPRGCALWKKVVESAIPVKRAQKQDVGAGLVQAPAIGTFSGESAIRTIYLKVRFGRAFRQWLRGRIKRAWLLLCV